MTQAPSDALVFFGATGDLAHKKIFPAQGDPTLFAREDAIEAEWRVVAPILTSTSPPHEYLAGTWGPIEADRLIERPGGWAKPFDMRKKP